MKLSEAIRLGSMLKPRGKGLYGSGKTCALGAALDALGRLSDVAILDRYVFLENTYPFTSIRGRCPTCGKSDLLLDVIWHVNDYHDWTRECIAGWVESIENAQSQPEMIPVLACDVSPETPQ